MTKHIGKFNLWKVTLALLALTLVVSLCVGAFAFADDGSGSGVSETPTYENIKAELTQKNIPDNHTETSIKNILKVTGEVTNTVDGNSNTTTVIVPNNGYTVAFNGGKLSSAEDAENGITVTVGDESLNVDMTGVNVVETTYTPTVIVLNYTLEGNYYVDKDGYDAFVQGMTANQALSRLAISLVSNNPYIEPEIITNVKWKDAANAPSFGDAPGSVNLAVEVNVTGNDKNGNAHEATATINVNTLHEFALAIEDGWQQPDGLTSASIVSNFAASLQGKVYIVYNNGEKALDNNGNIQYITTNVASELSQTTLVGLTAEALIKGPTNPDFTYDIDMEIPAGQNHPNIRPLVLELKDVAYVSPLSESSKKIQGTMPIQQARSELNFGNDLYISLSYKSGRYEYSTKVYLNDLIKEGFKIENIIYYIGLDAQPENAELTKGINGIDFSCGEYSYSGDLSVDPIAITRPTMLHDGETIEMSDDCYTTIDGLVIDDPQEDNMKLSIPAGVELKEGKYVFPYSGEFKFKVTFIKGEKSDFYWSSNGGGSLVDDNKSVEYTIIVANAPVKVSLENFGNSGNTEFQYGDNEPSFNVKGVVENSQNMGFDGLGSADRITNTTDWPALNEDGLYPNDTNRTNKPRYRLVYTGTELIYNTEKNEEEKNENYLSYTFPENRGTYEVHVETLPTSWLQAGKSDTISFTITQRKIALSGLTIAPKTYDRSAYAETDVVKDETVSVDGLQGTDTVTTVMSYKFASAAPLTDGKAKHAGTYPIEFTITNTNYVWADDKTNPQTFNFVINPRTLSLTVSASGFTYGDSNANPNPKLTYTDGGNSVSSSGFYAKVSEPVYSKIVDGEEVTITDILFSTWSAGNYKVKYTTSTDTDNGDADGDYNLPTAEFSFTIDKRTLTKVTVNGNGGVYNGNPYEFTFGNWSDADFAATEKDGNALKFADVFEITLSGVLANSTTSITTNLTVDYANGKVSVVEAGTYSVTVAIINSNYEWENGDTSNAERSGIVISQKELELSISRDSFEYDGSNQYATVTTTDVPDSQGSVTFTTEYYSVANGNETKIDNPASIINAGTYKIKVTDFAISGKIGSASYTYWVNYKLKESYDLQFVIVAPSLVRPELNASMSGVDAPNKVTVVYQQAAYTFSDYVQNWESNYVLSIGDAKQEKVIITIRYNGGVVNALDVAREYTVSIKPTSNYYWAGGAEGEQNRDEVDFTFLIKPKTLIVNWTDATVNQMFNGSEHIVEKYVLNNYSGDEVDVVLEYSGALTDDKVVNAGEYVATAVSLTGKDSGNYVLPETKPSTKLTIDKYSLEAPQIKNDGTALTFNGANQEKELTLQDNSSVSGFNWNTVVSYSVAGKWKFDNVEYGTHTENATFSFASATATKGTLTVKHAGEYTLTFTLEDTANYEWKDASKTTLTLTVNRKEIEAPALGEQRTLEYKTNEETKEPVVQVPTLTVDGIILSFEYGTGADFNGELNSTAYSKEYGLYFVKLNIAAVDGQNPLDYQWIANVEDLNHQSITKLPNTLPQDEKWGKVSYSATETSVFLRYMITKGILYIDYEVSDYVFGDNGYSVDGVLCNLGWNVNGKTSNLKMVANTNRPNDITFVEGHVTETLNFYKVSGKNVDSAAGMTDDNLLNSDDLVNNLPWEKGYYGVYITLTFNDPNSQFDTIYYWATFEVKAREITISWTGDTSVAYNGQERDLTATVANKICKSSETDVVAVPVLTVALDGNGALPVNARDTEYVLYAYLNEEVNEVANSNYSNFVLPTNHSQNIKINKRVVNLNVVIGEYKSIYGNTLIHSSAAWAYTENCSELNKFVEDATNYVTYKLHAITDNDGFGSEITTAMPNAGYYWLVPALTDSAASNYSLNYDYKTVKYQVEQRQITVTLNTDNATSVYGQQIELYNEGENGVYKVEWTNGGGEWWIGIGERNVTNVFTLSTTATNTSDVGADYIVTLTVVDGVNYAIKVNDNESDAVTSFAELGKWAITPASITNASVTQGSTPTYNGQPHGIIGELVKVDYALVLSELNDSSVQWFYTTATLAEIEADTAEWIEVTNLTQTDAINRNYYFKVKANNHNELVVGACDVVVNKAQLTVRINMSIWYGEKDPANYLGTNVAYNATVAELLKANTSGAMYFVDGFKTRDGKLETIGDIISESSDGTFTYTTTYVQGNDAGGEYYIAFENQTLTAANYEFVNNTVNKGVLTVKKLMLDVVISDATNVYYDTYSEVKFKTAVTLPVSTYTGTTLTKEELFGNIYDDIKDAAGYEGSNVFTLTTAAFADTQPTTYSKPVADYDITGQVKDNNYDATFRGKNGKPVHSITKAAIDANDIKGYLSEYDESEHNLIFADGGVFATASNGSTVNVQFYEINLTAEDEFDAASAEKWATFDSVVGSVPTSIDVCRRAIYYRLYVDGNYEDIYGVVEAKITPAENAFKADGVFGIAKNSWTYGLASDDNSNGYDETKHKITDPVAKFDRKDGADGANKFVATLSVKNGGTLTVLLTTDGETLVTASSLIAEAWRQGLFNVGTYVLSVKMDDTANYTNANVNTSVEFTVTAKELTITAKNQTVIYGNDFKDGYAYDVTGFVVSKTDGETEAETNAFAGMNTDFFTTAYVKGRVGGSVGKYDIVTTENAIEAKGNYTFTYVTANKALTVTPREVTVTIGDYRNLYNESTASGRILNYSLVNGSFYEEDQNVLLVRTLAIAGYGIDSLSATTNNVIVAGRNLYGQPETWAAYPVYVIFDKDAKGDGKDEYNYVIKFSGCSYEGELKNYESACDEGKMINIIAENDTPIVGGAGSYWIDRTVLSITYNGVYHIGDNGNEVGGTVYSGAVNYYKATTNDQNVKMTFKYGYNKSVKGNYVDIDPDKVVDAGYYIAYGRLSSDNYYDNLANQEFEIEKATVKLTANPSTVQYGTTLKGNEPNNTLDGRFSGFTYEYDKGTLLQSVYDSFIGAHSVTYTVDGYTPQSNVGSTVYLLPVCADDENGNISVEKYRGALTVEKRKVTVTLKGYPDNEFAQCDYLGTYNATQAKLEELYKANWSSFMSVDSIGDSGDSLDKLAVIFTLPSSAVNANSDGYGMSVRSGESNYSVEFKTANGKSSTIPSDTADAPKFVINKAKLTIYAHLNGTGVYTVTYGNELKYNDLNNSNVINYSVSGMQNGENFRTLINVAPTYSVMNGAKAYAAWESNVGETYTVSVAFVGGVLDNYELDADKGTTYVTATLTIDKRIITVNTEDQEFTWDGKDYHNGEYGKAHEAVFKFEDALFVSEEANANVNVSNRPVGYVVNYSTNAAQARPNAAGTAPTIVGEYTVTVTLAANGNYTFANGLNATKDFNITPRIIREGDLTWDPSSKYVEGEEKSGLFAMNNYVNAIMEVRMFTYYPNGQSGSTEIYQGTAGEVNAYYFDGQAMKISAEGRGRYEVIIQLKDSATHNYLIMGNHGALAYSSFVITSTSVNLTLTINDWVYNSTPNLPDAKLNGDVNNDIVIHYARVNDENVLDFYGNGADNRGAIGNIDGLNLDGSWISSLNVLTFNAGYYVVRAQYSGTVPDENGEETAVSATLYYVFKVDTAKVSVPSANIDGYVYNGEEQSLIINYATNLVRVSYNGHTGTSGDGIVVYATDAKTYAVTFTLIDTANYEWETGGVNAFTLNWVIAQDATVNGEEGGSILSAAEQTDKEYGGVSINGETVKSGYNGLIERSYVDASGKDFETVNDWANDAEWIAGLPENVGNYYVKLVLKGNSNFTDKVTYVKLNVMPKEVTVTASGTVTYGNDWQSGVVYEGAGLYGHKVVGKATFALAENYGTLQAGGTYFVVVDNVDELTMVDDNDNDVSNNYVIRAGQGRLIVNRRPVTVTLGSASSQYGKDIDLSKVSVRYGLGQLVEGDDLKLLLKTAATNESSVGGYTIDAEYDNDNYIITIVQGAYTIMQREVTVVIDSVKKVVYGDTSVNKPIEYSVLDGTTDITDFVNSHGFTLTVTYSGIANDGTSVNNSTAIPVKAGNYTATIRGSGSANFIIVGEPFATFVISKKEVDGSLITIANQTYTGNALTPVLNTQAFETAYGSDIFEEVARSEEFINAGAHTVTLRINDFNNYKWKSVEIATRDYIFNVDKAENTLTSDIVISGWIYGEYSVDSNLPSATVKFGQDKITFLYSNALDGTYHSGAPEAGDVGNYYVRVSVPATDNYNAYVSDPVMFAISKKALAQPSLTIITDGEGKNDVYTGSALLSAIVGYDMTLMNLDYDDINVSGGQIIARAVNAGTYVVRLSIANTKNYCWLGTEDNEIALTWIIAPKAVAKPTPNNDRYMVNGKVLTYIPVGFDEETMTISGNETAYGGEFPVTIGLKDKANYVWAEGDTDDYIITWNVVGINTVFTIVVSVIGGASGIALIAIGGQFVMDHRRKRLRDKAIDERSKAEDKNDKGGKN